MREGHHRVAGGTCAQWVSLDSGADGMVILLNTEYQASDGMLFSQYNFLDADLMYNTIIRYFHIPQQYASQFS